MTIEPIKVLLVGAAATRAAALAAAGLATTTAAHAGTARQHDAVIYSADGRDALAQMRQLPGLAQAAFDSAVLVLSTAADDALEAELLTRGVQAVVTPGDGLALARAVRQAVARKQAERLARTAYATDLATGLPHQAQLVEHMTQLLALREREPAPMVLIVLRVEGYAAAAAQMGGEAANVLRRKVAVRLRGLLRASDVVAAIGPDAFGVLLGRLEAKSDGERVAAKLLRALRQPITVAGHPCAVDAAVGLALYPDHGKDAQALLQRASAQAGSVAPMGAEGFAGATTLRGGTTAANDPG
jgi:diguanylate cyclase (GGDEF)-like protein